MEAHQRFLDRKEKGGEGQKEESPAASVKLGPDVDVDEACRNTSGKEQEQGSQQEKGPIALQAEELAAAAVENFDENVAVGCVPSSGAVSGSNMGENSPNASSSAPAAAPSEKKKTKVSTKSKLPISANDLAAVASSSAYRIPEYLETPPIPLPKYMYDYGFFVNLWEVIFPKSEPLLAKLASTGEGGRVQANESPLEGTAAAGSNNESAKTTSEGGGPRNRKKKK